VDQSTGNEASVTVVTSETTEGTTRQQTGRSSAPTAGRDHRHEPFAGEACADDRLVVHRGTVRRGQRAYPTAPRDQAPRITATKDHRDIAKPPTTAAQVISEIQSRCTRRRSSASARARRIGLTSSGSRSSRNHVGARQGQLVRHQVKALPGNPYEGHALKTIILASKYGGGRQAAAAFADHVKGGARGAAPEFG
jgi:hypothetical protein